MLLPDRSNNFSAEGGLLMVQSMYRLCVPGGRTRIAPTVEKRV